MQNVSVKLDRWTKYQGGVFDNRPTRVLDPIETHDTPGFSIRCADGVSLKNCSVSWGRNLPDYFAGALETESVTGLRLTGFQGTAVHPGRDAAMFVH
jgi:hypothetical protein